MVKSLQKAYRQDFGRAISTEDAEALGLGLSGLP